MSDIVKKERTPQQALVRKMLPAITGALPQHKDPQRFAGIILTVLDKNPKLMKCTMPSLMGAIMLSSILGLEVGDHLGQCYIIPYSIKGTLRAQFQIGYKGYPILLRDNIIYAHVVREGDIFDYQYGLHKDLTHKPDSANYKNKITHAYAVIKTKQGVVIDFLVMGREELDKVRASSKASDSPAYINWLGEMFRKAPLKRICKTAPLSAGDRKAVSQDETTKDYTPGMTTANLLDAQDSTEWIEDEPEERPEAEKIEPKKKKAEPKKQEIDMTKDPSQSQPAEMSDRDKQDVADVQKALKFDTVKK